MLWRLGLVRRRLWRRRHLLQDHQHAVVAILRAGECLLVALVKRAHGVSGDHQNSSPDGKVKIAAVEGQIALAAEHGGVEEGQQHDQDHTGAGRQRGVAASK